MITPAWEELFASLEGLALAEHSYPYHRVTAKSETAFETKV